MDPVFEALLFLLRKAHASGNHPDGEAEKLIAAVEAEYSFLKSHGVLDSPLPAEGRFMKLYPCGCSAGPGPADMPDYCSEHGSAEDPTGCVTLTAPMKPIVMDPNGHVGKEAEQSSQAAPEE